MLHSPFVSRSLEEMTQGDKISSDTHTHTLKDSVTERVGLHNEVQAAIISDQFDLHLQLNDYEDVFILFYRQTH